MRISHCVQITSSAIFLDNQLFFEDRVEVDQFLLNAFKHLAIAYPKFYKMDAMSKAGFIAAEILMKHATKVEDLYQRGIVFQNTSSSLNTDIKYQHSIKEIPSPALFVYTLPNIVMGEVAIRHHFKGENTFFVSEGFNPTQLIDYTRILFKEGVLSQALVGYIEVMNQQLDIFCCLVEQHGEMPFNVEHINQLQQRNLKL